jgi:ABC-2 type transport system ATP-binding protein
MAPVIEARGLTRRFGELLAVDRVDFAVEAGELFGFLGPNGAGKTTTVRMLTGVIEPTDGTAVVNGHDVRRQPTLARQGLGIVPEEANVYLDLSVWRNVMLMAELHGVPRADRTASGRRWLGELGLGERHKQKARALSKGLRQRLMLCTALVSDPDVLFLDEPTSGLDVQSARLIRQKVRELNAGGRTVFLTTHNMREAEEMCSRVAIIDHGHIAAIDTPQQLRGAMQSSQYVEVRFAGGPGPEELAELPGVLRCRERNGLYRLYTESPGPLAMEAARLAESEGRHLQELRTCKPSLEDVFLQITATEGDHAVG